jgi:hypothetical protein
MGSSTWICHTTYTPDIKTALVDAQREVFENKLFKSPRPQIPSEEQIQRQLLHIEQTYEWRRDYALKVNAQVEAALAIGLFPNKRGLNWTRETLTLEFFKKEYLDSVEKAKQEPIKKFRSISGLRRICEANGTHSILDIRRISSKLRSFTASPLSDAEQNNIFETCFPTSSIIETKMEEIADRCAEIGWSAIYVVAYTQKAPTQIYFIGVTGD